MIFNHVSPEEFEKLKAKEAARSIDNKIIAYEFHYMREAVIYIREGKLKDMPRLLDNLDKRIEAAAKTVNGWIEDGRI